MTFIPIDSYLELEVERGAALTSGAILSRALQIVHDEFHAGFASSFPDAKSADKNNIENPRPPSLGERLVIFGAEDLVAAITKNAKVEALRDYLHVSRVRAVRATSEHISWRRVRDAVSTPATRARIIRRAQRRATERGEMNDFDTDPRFKLQIRGSSLPHVNIRSKSTGQSFTMRIDSLITATAQPGLFDSYGFSVAGANVPLL